MAHEPGGPAFSVIRKAARSRDREQALVAEAPRQCMANREARHDDCTDTAFSAPKFSGRNPTVSTDLEVGLGLAPLPGLTEVLKYPQFAILPPQNASGNWVKVVHPVVDIEISSEIVASPDFAPYLSFELIYTVAVECALPGLTEVPVSNHQSDLRSVETVGFRHENFGAEQATPFSAGRASTR